MNSSAPWFYAENVLTSIKVFLGLNLILTVLIIAANGMFLVTLIRKKSLQTPTNILLGALSISDLLVWFVLEPLWIWEYSKRIEHEFSNRLLALRIFFMYVVIGLSFLYIAVISLEWYIAICHPFKYVKFVTARRTAIAFALTLLFLGILNAASIMTVLTWRAIFLFISSGAINAFNLFVIIACNFKVL